MATDYGFSTLCANDHMTFSTPWLDGPTALAAVLIWPVADELRQLEVFSENVRPIVDRHA